MSAGKAPNPDRRGTECPRDDDGVFEQRLLELRLDADRWPHLDAEGLSLWFEWELAALEVGLDPDMSVDELRALVPSGEPAANNDNRKEDVA